MELGFGRCIISLRKFGGIGLFTCKMTLYTYYMRPNYMVYRKAQDVACGDRFPSKMHVLLLNLEERKIRQVRRPPPLFRQKLIINLTKIRMKNYFKPNEAKK